MTKKLRESLCDDTARHQTKKNLNNTSRSGSFFLLWLVKKCHTRIKRLDCPGFSIVEFFFELRT